MNGSIYFGGLHVNGNTDISIYAVDKEELQKKIQEDWKQEVRTVIKFIDDSKLEMPLMKEVLSNLNTEVLIQEYREHKIA